MKFMYTPSVQCSEEGANDRRSRVQLTGEAGKPLALNDPTTSDTSCQVNMQMISTETVSFGEIRIYKGDNLSREGKSEQRQRCSRSGPIDKAGKKFTTKLTR